MNMLSSVAPWDMVAEGYSDVTMEFFTEYAQEALKLVGVDNQKHILDVACGPGTLSLLATQTAASVKGIDFSQEMITILQNTIERDAHKNIEIFCGDAQQLPYQDAAFDAAFSMFGLMFFPDRMQGLREIRRTLKPGGKTLIASWAPTSQSPMMMLLFGALKAMNPDIPEPQTDIESLENPEFFKNELEQAGFKQVEIIPISKGFTIDSIEEFWEGMIKGSAPLVMMKNNMPEDLWQEKNKIALDYLQSKIPTLPTSVTAEALFGIGVK